MFPINKYKFYQSPNKVIAVSTYCGKPVRGVATCADGDEFNLEIGKKLAAARCELKVSMLRRERARKKFDESLDALNEAQYKKISAENYYNDAKKRYLKAIDNLEDVFKSIYQVEEEKNNNE